MYAYIYRQTNHFLTICRTIHATKVVSTEYTGLVNQGSIYRIYWYRLTRDVDMSSKMRKTHGRLEK